MNKKKPSLFSMMGNRLYYCKIVNKYYKRPSKFESAMNRIELRAMFNAFDKMLDEHFRNK